MTAKAQATNRSRLWIAVIAVVSLCTARSVTSQIGPVPPQPPVPASSESTRSDETKAGDEKSGAGAKSKQPKADPVKEALEKVRSWTLYDFVEWLRDHGLSIV